MSIDCKEKLDKIIKAADAGSSYYKYKQAEAYFFGNYGLEVDTQQGFKLLNELVRINPMYNYNLGVAYLTFVVAQRFATISFEQAAIAGHIEAMRITSDMYGCPTLMTHPALLKNLYVSSEHKLDMIFWHTQAEKITKYNEKYQDSASDFVYLTGKHLQERSNSVCDEAMTIHHQKESEKYYSFDVRMNHFSSSDMNYCVNETVFTGLASGEKLLSRIGYTFLENKKDAGIKSHVLVYSDRAYIELDVLCELSRGQDDFMDHRIWNQHCMQEYAKAENKPESCLKGSFYDNGDAWRDNICQPDTSYEEFCEIAVCGGLTYSRSSDNILFDQPII